MRTPIQMNPPLATDSSAARVTAFWPYELLLGLMPLLIGFNLLLSTVYLPLGLRGFADFRQLYTGGYIVRTGSATHLYDYGKQQQLEEQLVPMGNGLHFLLPITHLAFEELFFAPLSVLSYRAAFWIFLAINFGLTLLCIQFLGWGGPHLNQRWRFFVPGLVASFFPVWRAILQGQDSILLLALILATIYFFEIGRPFSSGLVLGIGLFKFHIVIPIALLLLIWKQRRFFAGFVLSALIALIVSAALVRTTGIYDYVHLVSAMSVNLSNHENVLRYATISTEMMNMRGLVCALLEGHISPAWTQVTVLAASSIVMLGAAWSSPSFPLAVTTASLVSYNFVAHDASILIIAIVQALNTRSYWRAIPAMLTWLAVLTAIQPRYGYLGSIAILALYLSQIGTFYNERLEPREHWYHTVLQG